jgi:hypothetical protein
VDGDARQVITRFSPGRTHETRRKSHQDAAVNIRPAYAEYKSIRPAWVAKMHVFPTAKRSNSYWFQNVSGSYKGSGTFPKIFL